MSHMNKDKLERPAGHQTEKNLTAKTVTFILKVVRIITGLKAT